MSQLSHLVDLINSVEFQHTSEAELQRGIAQVLVEDGITHTREAILTVTDRIDFLVGGVGIEVKVDGSLSSVTRQLHRYAQLGEIESLILVTTRMRHCNIPSELNGKRIAYIWLSSL